LAQHEQDKLIKNEDHSIKIPEDPYRKFWIEVQRGLKTIEKAIDKMLNP